MTPNAPQYIVWLAVHNPAKGKWDKFPVDHRSGEAYVDAHNPAIWTDRATAERAARLFGPAYGVGFVLTPPYWCLDLDACYDATAGAWKLIVSEMITRFPGAYVEVSYSGTGIHIMGRGAVPPHGTRSKTLGAELYSQRRFIALTGAQARGDAETEHGPAIAALAREHFPPAAVATPVGWTDRPCEGYGGPTDDDDLIRKARASQSPASVFGDKASFGDLWTADESALGRTYPDAHGGRAYDASAADMALAQHLAFWTGKDCERIERLMRQSGLVRDKWDQRPDYLRTTIQGACSRQTTVATGRREATAPSAGAAPPPGVGIVLAADLPRHFEGLTYIEDRYVAAAPDGTLLSPQQVRASHRYGGRAIVVTGEGKVTRNAWEAFTENENWRPPFAHGLCFRPEHEGRALIAEGGRVLYNAYVPARVESRPGDVTPFLEHLRKMFPNERDRQYILGYMARCVQSPGVKLQWCPVIQGCEGNGKTFLGDVVIRAVGEKYCHTPSASDLSNKFNGWLDQKLFIVIEEIYVSDHRDLMDTLKPMITNHRVEIQRKGADQILADNRANFLAFTNHKNAVPKFGSDRRYAHFFSAQQEASDLIRDGMDGDYFPRLYRWHRHEGGASFCTHFLQHYKIPVEFDPAVTVHRAPETSSTNEARMVSLGVVEQAILEAIAQEDQGFRGGWISSHHLGLLLESRHLRNRCPPNQWDLMMREIGYVRHPALPGGRLNSVLAGEGGKKSRLWVKKDTIQELNLASAKAVAEAYSKSNGIGGLAA